MSSSIHKAHIIHATAEPVACFPLLFNSSGPSTAVMRRKGASFSLCYIPLSPFRSQVVECLLYLVGPDIVTHETAIVLSITLISTGRFMPEAWFLSNSLFCADQALYHSTTYFTAPALSGYHEGTRGHLFCLLVRPVSRSPWSV